MTAQAARNDVQRALQRPVPTIPSCPKCTKQRVLYGGVCGPCGDEEAADDLAVSEALETRREARKGYDQ